MDRFRTKTKHRTQPSGVTARKESFMWVTILFL